MRNACRNLVQLIIVWFLCVGATYYVKNGGDDNLNGLSDSNAWETLSKVQSTIQSGDTVYLEGSSTWYERLTIGVSNITIEPYGTGRPRISGLTSLTGWSQYAATSIYSVSYDMLFTDGYGVCLEDGTKLENIEWDTDIATTSSSMSAGTWSYDDENNLMYAWVSDGSDPDTKTMQASLRSYCIDTDDKSNISISGIDVDGAISAAIHFGGGDGSCSIITVDDMFCENVGGRCFVSYCDNTVMKNSEATTFGTENATYEWPGFIIGYADNGLIENNYAHDSTYGGAIELNWDVTNTIARNNRAENVWKLLEIWDESNNNQVYNNIGKNVGFGIWVQKGSFNNKVFNNIINGFTSTGIGANTISETPSYNNEFYNNVVYGSGNEGAYFVKTGCVNNIFKNNIAYVTGGVGLDVDDANNTFDNNLYYRASGNLIDWNGTTYTMAQFSTYKSATSQDANSVTGDPLFLGTNNFAIQTGSPAKDAGAELTDVTYDYRYLGRPQGSGWDIGAYEFGNALQASGVTLSGVNLN